MYGAVGLLGTVAVVLCAALIVALWAVSTEHRRDEVARDFAREVFLVDGITEMGSIRTLHPYFVRGTEGSMVILAKSQMDAAELVAQQEGDRVEVSTLLGKYRVVRLPQGGWAVAVLPGWLGFLGRSNDAPAA
jgi:hypothetical protein